MNSTVMPNSTEANDALAARADERLAHAYEQITRADEQLARLTEQLTRMEQDAPSHPQIMPGRGPSRGRPALRGLVGLLAAACIVGAAFVSQSSYGEAAKPAITRWVAPYVSSASWLPLGKPDVPAQPGPSGVRLAAAEPALLQATPARAQDSASAPSALESPELTLLQTMARDLTTVQQGIAELKASQERMATDNARAVEQFRASQEQLTRLVAKVSEQDARVRVVAPAAPPPRPVAEPARRPAPSSSQARAQPLQLQPNAR